MAPLSAVLESGQITNGGELVHRFEDELERILGQETLCFASGMAALIAMLMAVGVEDREVICPSFTFPATPAAICIAGGIPVFADINIEHLTLSPMDVERKINKHTAAILAVDAYGICADYQQLSALADKKGAWFLVDAAPSFGSNHSYTVSGKWARIHSFHATKALAVGEGGCLCSNDRELLDRAKTIRNFGLTGEMAATVGFNGKMTEISAMIGLANLNDFAHRANLRRHNHTMLRTRLDMISGIRDIAAPIGQDPVWTYFPMLISPLKAERNHVTYELSQAGIGCRRYYGACHLDPAYRVYHRKANLPVTEGAAEQVLALPCHESLSYDDINYIGDVLQRILS